MGFTYRERIKPMRQNIIDSLEKLFSGTIDTIKVTCHTPKSHNVIQFEMLGHVIQEGDGLITVYDDKDNHSMPKTVNIDPSVVDSVMYTDDKADSLVIYQRNMVISMKDESRIEMCTMGMG